MKAMPEAKKRKFTKNLLGYSGSPWKNKKYKRDIPVKITSHPAILFTKFFIVSFFEEFFFTIIIYHGSYNF